MTVRLYFEEHEVKLLGTLPLKLDGILDPSQVPDPQVSCPKQGGRHSPARTISPEDVDDPPTDHPSYQSTGVRIKEYLGAGSGPKRTS